MRSNTLPLILPFAALTATGLLATDLYLPAVPALAGDLNGTVPQAQATLAVFLAALALSQLLWGVAADRFGGTAILKWAIALQVLGGIACALAPSLTLLIAARALQGLGVGAANVVVAMLVRQRFSDADSVRAMSWLGIAESMVPALGPIAGAALLTVTTWRASFWIVAAVTLCAGPLALRALHTRRPPPRHAAPASPHAAGYGPLLHDHVYLGYACGHALCFAALLTFVASAPQVIAVWLAGMPRDFALLQVFGVSAFVLAAAQGGRLTARHGIDALIMSGVVMQLIAVAAMLLLALAEARSYAALAAAWVLFCGALGLRGPATMTRALSVAPPLVGRAAGLLMFLALGLAAGGTQLAAPFLGSGLLPVALICLGYTLASAALMLLARRWRAQARHASQP